MFRHSWEVFVGEPVEVKAKFTGKAAKVVASGRRHPSEKILIQKDGSVIYSAAVAGLEEISHWLLSFGSEAEVLEPGKLRDKFAEIGKRLNQIYTRRYSLVAERGPTYRAKPIKR